jgi:hypothetical protein
VTGAAAEVAVVGTAGGVGTTTVAALLFAELAGGPGGGPRLLDHAAGQLEGRLAVHDRAATRHPETVLHDLGPRGHGLGLDRLHDAVVVLVAPATPAGTGSADEALTRIDQLGGSAALARVLVACVEVFGHHRLGSALVEVRSRLGEDRVMLVPRDRALAAGGPIPTVRLAPRTRQAQHRLGSLVAQRLDALNQARTVSAIGQNELPRRQSAHSVEW